MRNAIFATLLILAMLLPASPTINLTNPATWSENGTVTETDLLAGAQDVNISRAFRTVNIVYAVGTDDGGAIAPGKHALAVSLSVNWATGAWSDSLGRSGTLTVNQLGSFSPPSGLRGQIGQICDGAENLALALGTFSGSKTPCS